MKNIHLFQEVSGSILLAATLLLTGCSGNVSQDVPGKEDIVESGNETETIELPVEEPTFKASSIKRVSVHDPSIIKCEESGKYYVFGTHLSTAVSDDLINWTSLSKDYEKVNDNPIYGKLVDNFADSFKWAGYNDGDCFPNGYAVWAPDVYYSKDYLWDDGSVGGYLMYYSASSTWRRSCIGLAVSKTIEGPYTGIDTIVYSGITKTGVVDGKGSRNTAWDNDYLNFNELLALGAAGGGIDEINEKWFRAKGAEYNTDYAPNCIDPCIVDGKDGKVYLVYGSWSGGLFILEIDPTTGLAKYPGVDGTDAESGNYIDRYYGVHIAGGNHQSGEGCFILYDAETDYYFMYETYGGLTANGGYNMRLFRSRNIYGPYEDAMGKNSAKNGTANYMYGIKLIGNYQFNNQRGYMSAGHNSVLFDNGNHYIIYHQRFNEGTEYHEVRVHQQFFNEDDWLVTAVYENHNEQPALYSKDAVIGDYEYVNFGTRNSKEIAASQTITLNEDGSVSGIDGATWAMSDADRGYNYVTITVNDDIYKGIFFRQTNDNGERVMTFTCIGNNNASIWGTK